MISKQALKLVHGQAYKPGFLNKLNWAYLFTDDADPDMQLDVRAHLALVALDREFWIALDKALKFDQPIWKCGNARCDNEFCEYAGWKNLAPDTIYGEVHKFLDVVLAEQPTDVFWQDLLDSPRTK